MDSSTFISHQASEKTACSKDKAMKLLREAFQLIISDGVDLRGEPEFCMIVDQLCEKTPKAAEAIAGTIQNSPKIDSFLVHSKILATRKRKPNKDPIYRPSKYARRNSNTGHDANLLLGLDSRKNDVSPKIWDYTKMSWKQLDALVENTQ